MPNQNEERKKNLDTFFYLIVKKMFRRFVNFMPIQFGKNIHTFNLNRVPIVQPLPGKIMSIQKMKVNQSNQEVLADHPGPGNNGSDFIFIISIAFLFLSLAYRSERHRWITN